jgi:hypothetical protein
MLITLHQAILHAEDRFLNDQELQGLERYVDSFEVRYRAYQLLSQRADELVMQALKVFAQTYRSEVETHGAKCKRDMGYVLQYIARAILMDDAEVFKQDFALWMENITRAVHNGRSAAQAYGCLKGQIQTALPAQYSALVVPYLDDLIMTLSDQ